MRLIHQKYHQANPRLNEQGYTKSVALFVFYVELIGNKTRTSSA